MSEVLSPVMDSQPDTAPCVTTLDDSNEDSDGPWGNLIFIGGPQPIAIELKKESFTVGRSPECDFSLRNVKCKMSLMEVSKTHFRVVRYTLEQENIQVTYLEDASSNGTFVNWKKVGRNHRVILNSKDEISLCLPVNSVFIYIDTSVVDLWLALPIRRNFHVLKQLGIGGFGEVNLVLEKSSYQITALKKVRKDSPCCNVYREIAILKNLNHPCIVRLREFYDLNDELYLSLEYIGGGHLLNYLKWRPARVENTTRFIFYQLFLATEYLHSQGVTHRDLKPENILITNLEGLDSWNALVKVTDFGLSKVISSNTQLKTACGTLRYAAPEVISPHAASYTSAVDVWSLGVLLFICLSGEYPFQSDTEPLPLVILRGAYFFKRSKWYNVSSEGKDLVVRMLVVSSEARISIEEALSHNWPQNPKMIQKFCSLAQILPEGLGHGLPLGTAKGVNGWTEPKSHGLCS